MANMLTQNTYLRKYGIHNWTLPAWVTRMPDGTNVNVCPAAGACVTFGEIEATTRRNRSKRED